MSPRSAAVSVPARFRRGRAVAVLLLAISPFAAGGCHASPTVLIAALPSPGPVAIEGSTVYVAMHEASSHRPLPAGSPPGAATWQSTLFAVPLAGSAPRKLAVIFGPPITDLAVRGGTLYFACAGCGTVSSLRPGDAAPRTLAAAQHEPWAIAVDATHVYFTSRGTAPANADGALLRVPLAGGPAEVVAAGLSSPMRLALDDDEVYVARLGTRAREYQDSSIVRVAKRGGPAVLLATSPGDVSGLAADGAGVYWSCQGRQGGDGAVFRVDRAGGQPLRLASGMTAGSIALDATSVYWTSWDGGVRRVPKRGGAAVTLGSGQDRPQHIAVGPQAVVWSNLGRIDGERELDGALMALRH